MTSLKSTMVGESVPIRQPSSTVLSNRYRFATSVAKRYRIATRPRKVWRIGTDSPHLLRIGTDRYRFSHKMVCRVYISSHHYIHLLHLLLILTNASLFIAISVVHDKNSRFSNFLLLLLVKCTTVCLNGGRCELLDFGSRLQAHCVCPIGFYGQHCEQRHVPLFI